MENNINKKIMRRVWLIYYFRKLANPFLVKFYFLAGLGVLGLSLVSIKNVFLNMPPVLDPIAHFNFWLSAFANTEFIIKFAILAFALLLLGVIWDASKNFSSLYANQKVSA